MFLIIHTKIPQVLFNCIHVHIFKGEKNTKFVVHTTVFVLLDFVVTFGRLLAKYKRNYFTEYSGSYTVKANSCVIIYNSPWGENKVTPFQ